MINEPSNDVYVNYFLESGYVFVATEPTVISTVFGSCVSVCIYDRKCKTGGMNHFLYPHINNDEETTVKHGNIATLMLIHMMIKDGSRKKDLEAQVLGGAYNAEISDMIDIGRKNVTAARRILVRQRIRIVSEDVGGNKERKIVFNTSNSEMAVLKVDRIRNSDWYPYEGSR